MNNWQEWAFKNDVWLEMPEHEKLLHPLDCCKRWFEERQCRHCKKWLVLVIVNKAALEQPNVTILDGWNFDLHGEGTCPDCVAQLKAEQEIRELKLQRLNLLRLIASRGVNYD